MTAKGVSRRIPWPGAPSRILTVKGVNPQNTLAKSKAMKSMCPKSSRPLEFFQCHLVFSRSFLFVQNTSSFPYFVQIPLPLSVTLPKLSNVMSSSKLRIVCTNFYIMCLDPFSTTKPFHAYYIMCAQICLHSGMPTLAMSCHVPSQEPNSVNTSKTRQLTLRRASQGLFVKLLGYAILWEVSLGKGNKE